MPEPSRDISRALGRGLLWAAVALGAALMLFPFLWTVITSITPQGNLSGGPSLIVQDPTLDAYRELFASIPVGRIVVNSFGVAVASTLLQLVTGSMAAYAFSRLAFRGKPFVFGCYLATLMIPLQVLVAPLFIMLTRMHLNDTYFALLAPNIASAFGIFLLKQAIDGVPKELDEAARIDGAGHLRIWGQVVMPLVKPAMAALTVFAFMESWNSFLWPLVVIRSPELMTLPLGLSYLQGQFTTEWNVVMAGSVVSILPIVVVYLFAQKHIIAGMAHTGLK
ncbi:MAG: carbohydrate ABC transporter permease [Propionibacteriaceae bacterium]|jgi:multiple sugar transport system permease protein|nr:carbohydrate ABC transporter permease [Propionibacteriaceae bacterium]